MSLKRSCRGHVACPFYCLPSYYWYGRNYWSNRKFGPRWFHGLQCRGRSWAKLVHYKGPAWFKWFLWDLGLLCERYTLQVEDWFELRAQRKADEAKAKFENEPLIKALRNYGKTSDRDSKA